MTKTIDQRTSFHFIRYANCWEDAEILVHALLPIINATCLSIASAGDNSLALLIQKPTLVVALDVSAAQLACVELRKVAFKFLTYEEMLWFLGFRPKHESSQSKSRISVYNTLRSELTHSARAFWDNNTVLVQRGIIYGGKIERYFEMFRKFIMPLIHSKKEISWLLEKKDADARKQFYDKKWNNLRWKLLCRIFCSRLVMGKAGRDPEFFRYVKGSVADRILTRAGYALTELATHNNPFLRFILTGSFQDTLPLYARKEHFNVIKNNLDCLELFQGTTDDAFHRYKKSFNAFNLSDIFEYMDYQSFLQVAENIVTHAQSQSRVVYWNMLVPRRISKILPRKVHLLADLSKKLALKDKAFFYQSFFIDEVVA